jgi:hypothetical protein
MFLMLALLCGVWWCHLIDRQTPQLAVPEATILTTLFPALLFRFRLPCTLKTGETLPNCSKMRRG